MRITKEEVFSIQAELLGYLSKFKGKQVQESTLNNINFQFKRFFELPRIREAFYPVPMTYLQFKFTHAGNGIINMIPKNIFSALFLRGVIKDPVEIMTHTTKIEECLRYKDKWDKIVYDLHLDTNIFCQYPMENA